MSRQVIGFLGPCPSRVRRVWNELLRREGRDAFFDGYPTRTRADLQLRLSEMYLLERRGYAVGKGLRGEALSMMDRLDASAMQAESVDTIVNDGGVFTGYQVGDILDLQAVLKRYRLFFGTDMSADSRDWVSALLVN
jgi:shikimate dehydrogenase